MSNGAVCCQVLCLENAVCLHWLIVLTFPYSPALFVWVTILNVFVFLSLFTLDLSSAENAGCCFRGNTSRGNSIPAKATLGLSLAVCPL